MPGATMAHFVLAVDVFRFSPGDQATMLARMLVAVVAGGILGWERKRAGHRAGIRTLAVVAIGSAIFTLASIYGFGTSGANTSNDPSRVAAQVATGVGFIGAGTIVVLGRTVHGLTTAATIWVAAAVGMAAGAGMYVVALAGAVLTTVVLEFLPHGDDDERVPDGP